MTEKSVQLLETVFCYALIAMAGLTILLLFIESLPDPVLPGR